MRKLFYNIGVLWGVDHQSAPYRAGKEMSAMEGLHNAWLLVEKGRIQAFGTGNPPDSEKKEDMKGREILPGFVDSHTHAVFATEREAEFVLRLRGAGYEEIAAAGGGILNSAMRLREMDEEELYEKAVERVKIMILHGTTTLEIKSGYGLDLESELKMLRVIKRLKSAFPIKIRATFLGAHAVPLEFKNDRKGYVDHVVEVMLPAVAKQELADHVDVFCDRGFFTPEETEHILTAARKYGLPAKIHANELGHTGGVQVAVKMEAWSADHLEHCGDAEIKCMLQSETMPVGLPGTSVFLGIPFAPGRKIIDAGLPFCLASDFNPGSSPVANMQLIWSLGCTQMKLLPEEAFYACTINGARALRLEKEVGSIAIGKQANFWTTNLRNAMQTVPYYFGQNHAKAVYVKGEQVSF